MKYLYVNTENNTLKYKDAKPVTLDSRFIINVEVDDEFIIEGDQISFILNTPLTGEETVPIIRTLSDGVLKVDITKEQFEIQQKNQTIKDQLKLLDADLPRAVEDLINLLVTDTSVLDPHLVAKLNQKAELRSELSVI